MPISCLELETSAIDVDEGGANPPFMTFHGASRYLSHVLDGYSRSSVVAFAGIVPPMIYQILGPFPPPIWAAIGIKTLLLHEGNICHGTKLISETPSAPWRTRFPVRMDRLMRAFTYL
ncbi:MULTISPECIES: hypothetical protein [Pirellulaceae]|uniref:hypothetical protein n=1 Tax=Pirellulaceae TaxID=2691357 RepID=UPI00130494B5|nr:MULTISPECIES: hypothetical protein [Pirellulaceae]